MVGTLRKKQARAPTSLNTWNMPINSSKFVFKADTSLLSYMPKKGKNVVPISTLHRDGRICGQEHQKTEIIMDYNATKGGVDNLNKLLSRRSCKLHFLQVGSILFALDSREVT